MTCKENNFGKLLRDKNLRVENLLLGHGIINDKCL